MTKSMKKPRKQQGPKGVMRQFPMHLSPSSSQRDYNLPNSQPTRTEKQHGRKARPRNSFTKSLPKGMHQSTKIYKSITKRNDVTQIARLRTGHCSLNQYLHRFGIEESPM